MNELQETFLSMIKAELWDAPFECRDGVSPAELFNEACRYEIAGVFSTKLDLFCQDDPVTRAQWSKKALSDYRKSLFVLEAQSSLCELLAREGVKPVFLKGMASAYYYPNPLLRQIGDIDFMIPPNQFDACCKLLEQNGYEKGIDGGRHLAFEKRGIEYECHRYFSRNISRADKREDQILYAACANCVTRSVEGKKYFALPDAEYGIVLLEHLKHHLVDGVGFRQVMDWVVYADAVLDDKLWHASFHDMALECGLDRLAKTMTRTAQLYLGLKTDGISWCCDVEEPVCAALLELLFSCNNFGFVEEGDEGMHKIGNVFRRGFFANLDDSATTHIPAAKKIVVLRPFAWAYQIARWGVKGTASLLNSNKRSDMSPKRWQEQGDLLKRIGI